jgi:hypothetical protein
MQKRNAPLRWVNRRHEEEYMSSYDMEERTAVLSAGGVSNL